MLELEGHAAVTAHIAAKLGKRMAHVGHGAGFVVGQAIYHHCCTANAVTFVAAFFVVDAFQVARATVDGALNGVLGHVGVKALVYGQAQTRVGGDVSTAHFGSDGDFLDHPGEDLAALGVRRGFFMLDIGPFAVSSHSNLNKMSDSAYAKHPPDAGVLRNRKKASETR